MKATHQGHCQVCGCNQRLPNDLLSTHGYTVACGFFSGICTGTKHLPFEQDISLIEGAIVRALEIKANIEFRVALYTNSTESNAWFHNYKPVIDARGRKRSMYVWEYLPVVFETTQHDGYWSHYYSYSVETLKSLSTRQSANAFDAADFPVAKIVEQQNAHYRAQVLAFELHRITSYISWQRDRIKNWKPSELKPVEAK